MPFARRFGPVVAVGLAFLLSGCGGTTGERASPPRTAECPPAGDRGTAPRETSHSPELTYLTTVKIESEQCVDRVEFAFRDGPAGAPGYRIAYLPADRALVEDGSGNSIEVRGGAYLVVRLEPAAKAAISGEELVRTYNGPKRLTAPEDAHFAREVVKSGDFEAVVTWVVGVSEQRPFTTTVSDSRLVIEIG
jgi:hypothetical protein